MGKKPLVKMPVTERAKQFSSFKALGGLEEALERKRREMGFEELRELSEDETEQLNRTLCALKPGDRAEICYYNGRGYETKAVRVVKIDTFDRRIITDGGDIGISGVSSITITESETE